MKTVFWFLVLFAILPYVSFPQSGGGFDLSHATVSGGGGRSAGGDFELEGTSGQGNAGSVITGPGFSVRDGFWGFQNLAPTAALVSLGGRVRTQEGIGVNGAVLTIADTSTSYVYQVRSNQFGYYRVNEIVAGETYIVSIWHRERQFEPNIRVIGVNADNLNVDFVSN